MQTYFLEKKLKSEFLQIKFNKTLRKELRYVLEVIPEGILIYDPESNKIKMVNSDI